MKLDPILPLPFPRLAAVDVLDDEGRLEQSRYP